MKTPAEKILVLDYGSQYTQLIARALRELGAYCEIRPHDLPDADIAAFAPRGIVLSGGPESALEPDAPELSDAALDAGVPTLGVCYGMQALAAKLGGELQASARREYGPAMIRRERESVLLDGAFGDGDVLPVWMSHGDAIVKAPPGFVSLATGGAGKKSTGGGEGVKSEKNPGGGGGGSNFRQDCRDGGRESEVVRAAVSSGGFAHAERAGDSGALCSRHLRDAMRVDGAEFY